MLSGRDDKMHGLVVVANPDIAKCVANVTYVDERIMQITLQLQHIKIKSVRFMHRNKEDRIRKKKNFIIIYKMYWIKLQI